MAITFNCSQCGKMVRIGDEYAGQKGRCPNCLAVIDIPGAVAASPGPLLEIPEEPALVEGVAYVAGPAGAAWESVRGGLGLVFAGSLILAITIAVAVVAVFLAGLAAAGGGPGAIADAGNVFAAGVCLTVLALLVALVLMIIGVCRCCAAPAESRARGPAVVSAVFLCIGVLLAVIAGITQAAANIEREKQMARPGPFARQGIADPEMSPGARALQVMAQLASLTGQLAFLVFLGRIGRYFGNKTLARGARLLVICTVLSSVLAVLAELATHFVGFPRELAGLYLAVGLVLIACGIGIFVWFLILVNQARSTIQTALRRQPLWEA